MKAIMVMYDSLNRRFLGPYGCQQAKTPNFDRLSQHALTFDQSYVGSMPCMPARRELHTGRYNFIHRSWGPLEPFDDSMPQLLKQAGIHTHLVSDHYHYWEDGGCTYHSRYSTWENVRGQEGEHWKGQVAPISKPNVVGDWCQQDEVNRQYQVEEEDWPQTKTFSLGLEFLEKNWREDNWFLQIETFDPHEPYVVAPRFHLDNLDGYTGPRFDWPGYKLVDETPEQVAHVRNEYAALIEQCDDNLGKVLDFMDAHDMWQDTLLIVNTDHGFLLGEHGLFAKSIHPFYNEIAHTPLFIWDPRIGKCAEHRNALVQTIDLAPTLLEYFNVPIPKDMHGKSLYQTCMDDTPIRKTALYGIHGGQVNITDGKYVYMRAPDRYAPLYDYTLMPCTMSNFLELDAIARSTYRAPFNFTKECPVMQIPAKAEIEEGPNPDVWDDMFFDLTTDPDQLHCFRPDEETERYFLSEISRHLKENDAPLETYIRWRIPTFNNELT